VFALTFLSRAWSIDKQREASQRQLEETIRTMPPRDFVAEFAKFYSQSHKAVQALDAGSPVSKEDIQAAIRMILHSIAQLARRFDAAQQCIYASNVMLYWSSVEQWQKHANAETMPNIRFVELEAALDRIPLLILEDSLTASTDCQPGDLDPAMRGVANLALPVPAEGRNGRSEDGRRWRVLPGAPLTFFTQKSNSYGNAGELGKWCRERGDFSESVASQIDQYFGQDSVRNVIGSFASMPIKSSLGGNSIGVLNLHSNGLEMLISAGAPSQFFPLAEPFTSLLADALQKLLKFDEKD